MSDHLRQVSLVIENNKLAASSCTHRRIWLHVGMLLPEICLCSVSCLFSKVAYIANDIYPDLMNNVVLAH